MKKTKDIFIPFRYIHGYDCMYLPNNKVTEGSRVVLEGGSEKDARFVLTACTYFHDMNYILRTISKATTLDDFNKIKDDAELILSRIRDTYCGGDKS